jgi:Tfp pilus assembly pilus retraction ATPase PilT
MNYGGLDLIVYLDKSMAKVAKTHELLQSPVISPILDAIAAKRSRFLTKIRTEKFSIDVENWGRYRVHLDSTLSGNVAILRHIKTEPVDFEHPDYHWPQYVKDLLMSEDLCSGGLVLIAGEVGVGKTTTAAAMIRSRNQLFGGTTWCLEDPIEYIQETFEGPGTILQKEVDSFSIPLAGVLRAYPSQGKNNTLFIGELRTIEDAHIGLSIASNGMLVVATYHAGSIIESIQRITGGHPDKFSVLEHSLKAIVHQSFSEIYGFEYKILETNQAVKALMRPERISELEAIISQQNKNAINTL